MVTDPALFRPADVHETMGDPSRARELLGWKPSSTFRELVDSMVQADLTRLRTGIAESPEYL